MKLHGVTAPITEQQEQLPCPRCNSTNTKFCYYNNYNFSQPRHLCKSCRRYWTHGGTIRDIPVGGSSRKSAKRSRSCSNGVNHTVTAPLNCDAKGSALSNGVNHNAAVTATNGSGSVVGLGGFGIGLGSGLDEASFGLGRAMWPFSNVGDAARNVGTHGGHHAVPIPATWQFEGLESNTGGFLSGEYFTWPDLSTTTPGTSLK